jgi:hypothetical protein
VAPRCDALGVADDTIVSFSEAALNKIGFARESGRELAALRRGEEDERAQIQRAFESVIGNGTSAGDQLSAALARRAGVRLPRNTPADLGRRAGGSDDELVRRLVQWAELPVVVDARRRRNLAVHAHYVKRPYRPELTWLLDPIQIAGEGSRYEGQLDVHSYTENYLAALHELEKIATRLLELTRDSDRTATGTSVSPTAFQRQERARLRALGGDEWGVEGHVLPYELAIETLHETIRQGALDYFARHAVKWWTSEYDKRTKQMEARPTGHLNSSQVACVNHLEPARTNRAVAQRVVANVDASLTAVAVDDGFVDYEWIGLGSYLGERGPRVRGAHITSLDALMCGERDGERALIAFEWKYLESYDKNSVAVSDSGTDRVATYLPLLGRDDCPIAVERVEWLFYEPYYQLMRQTLLAWQMVEHGEFDAADWLHVHVVPERNIALRQSKAAPELEGETMEQKWRSVLREPGRYRLMTAGDLVAGIGDADDWHEWRQWLNRRYLT